MSPLFSPIGKIRMAMDLFLPRRDNSGDESLADFVQRRLGQEALERIAQPLLGGVYTADPAKLSLRATMPRFLELEAKYGSVIKGLMSEQSENSVSRKESGARYGSFVSLDDGMQVLVDAIVAKLPSTAMRLNSAVLQVVPGSRGSEWDVVLESGERLSADVVVLATSAKVGAGLVSGADAALASELARVESASSAVINLMYNRDDIAHRLDGFGFVVPAVESSSLIACSFSSVKFAGRAPYGKVLLRAFIGGALNPHVCALDDDELLRLSRRDLRRYLGVSAEPIFTLVSRWPRSMPQYQVEHLDLVEKIASRLSSLPGLYVAGSAYRGVGIPDCIQSGEQAAESIYENITGSIKPVVY
jgi:oxygen-dependent protoporphyrinogen oxidase